MGNFLFHFKNIGNFNDRCELNFYIYNYNSDPFT